MKKRDRRDRRDRQTEALAANEARRTEWNGGADWCLNGLPQVLE